MGCNALKFDGLYFGSLAGKCLKHQKFPLSKFCTVHMVQWNLCITNTLGPTKSVLIIKVSCFSRSVSLYDKAPFGTITKCVAMA